MGFYGVHPDHNLRPFDYLQQGSQIFYFKCYLKSLEFHLKNSFFLVILGLLLPNCFTEDWSDIQEFPLRYQLGHLIWKVIFFGLCESGGCNWRKNWKFGTKIRFWGSFGLQAYLFSKYAPLNPITMVYPIMLHNCYL